MGRGSVDRANPSSDRLGCAVQSERSYEVIGHRGSSAEAPENTEVAIERAIERGADRVELDVQELADGTLAIVHDLNLRRLAGVDRASADLTAADLARLDVGAWFGPAFAGARIPTLAAVLHQTAGRIGLNLELKRHGRERDLVGRVVAELGRAGAIDQCVVTSFHGPWLAEVRSIDPAVAVGPIFGPDQDPAALLAEIDRVQPAWSVVSLAAALVTPALAQALIDRGQRFWVWTVDEAERIDRLVQAGACGIITNRPHWPIVS